MSLDLRAVRAWGTIALLCAAGACSPSSLVDTQSPSSVVDPSTVNTAVAAMQLYASAVANVSDATVNEGGGGGVVELSGLLTDELTETSQSPQGIDSRVVSNGDGSAEALYRILHVMRVQSSIARQSLKKYGVNPAVTPPALQGHLYAIEGYAVLWFAELYCSGIPLTSVSLDGAQQLTRGFTTQELFTKAAALFDSAMVLGADSARFVNLARVGKGRALLGLGQFAAADSAVQGVPIDFVYSVQFTPSGYFPNRLATGVGLYRAQDNEGTNGLTWSTDPRSAIVTVSIVPEMLWPAKYYVTAGGGFDPLTPNPGAPVRMADGLEAQLIHAEAALAAGDGGWLTTLNMLRATCVGTASCAPVPGLTTAALPALGDPGTDADRLDLLMRERAMWLYMTGHREGDLRRLAHVYHRDPNTLWPVGTIVSPAFPELYGSPLAINGTLYGPTMVFGPYKNEVKFNPLYGGCYDTNP